MRFMFIVVFSGLLQRGLSVQYPSFLDEFFRFKNVKTVFLTSCSSKNYQLVFSWRKSSLQSMTVQLAKKPRRLSSHPVYGEPVGIVLDPACDISQTISSLRDAVLMENKCIVVAWNKCGSDFVGNSTSLGLRNAIDFFYASTNGSGVSLYDQRMALVMKWEPDSGLTDLGHTDRLSLSGKTISGMISLYEERLSNNDGWQILEQKSFITDNLMKFSFVIHQYLEKLYGFRWDLRVSPHTSEAVYAFENGSLSYNFVEGDQFEALKTGTVDVGLFPAEQLSAGLDFMEFLQPFATFRQYFVFSRPVSYLEPHIVYSQFSGAVWGVSIALSLMVAIISSVSVKTVIVDDDDSNELTFVTNVLNIVAAIAQQGLERSSNKLSVRIAHFFLLFLTVMLFMFYNTGLLMYTLDPSLNDVKSFEELLRQGYSMIAEDTPNNKFHLQGNYSQPEEWFYQNCISDWGACRLEVDFYNLTFGASRVKAGRTAIFGYAPNIYSALEELMTDKELADLKEIPVHKHFLISTFVRKHFPYKELFSRGLLLLKEAGIIYHEDHFWNERKPEPLIDSYFVIASLYSTSVAFALLFVGILASLAVFTLELFFRKGCLAMPFNIAKLKHLPNRQLVSQA